MSAILGWLVAIIDIGQFIPQARHTLEHRDNPRAMRGVSVWTWTIATIQGAAWVIYGLGTHHLAVGVPNLVITPICALILALRLRALRA
ncbi:hypothetical protein [Nocardioides sp. Kera G14]|uniref:hypothetical protein n=1 Tax=Nocardioides sp. Kera G14 TaxID=2884264 RepID=UPI001D10A8F2|nr:hypothetical protein [Nocardioides sp. Kera G14]UDY24164.1 hypothetical protein LH076_02380 [Nocardioides sp. Kera G14]